MKGQTFLVGGDPATARNTVYAALENQGFTLTHIDDWSADAERGSSGASVLLGAFAGKKGRHVKLRVTCESAPEGTVITLTQGTSGVSGGLIGVSQASSLYSDIYNAVGLTFQNAGVLISRGNI
ncbi:MAG: hypothetical protein VB081_01830 [Christensenella sp.]|uniref:hypothetical protein n=1 Tax=Christensenella sp. TaxID=1935934 RepID=UPI002B20CA3C|nr:hypothetical protein [Christensenella sp.]MEA5002219.1 hypothetical protein [Christensenella sp.]